MTVININVNGKKISKEISDNTLLSDFLRDRLNLTGTHVGCDTSQCGACVVHLNGNSIKSCTTLVIDCADGQITTIEGLSTSGDHPVQQAWVEHRVPQCGYCQSGQVMAAVALLKEKPNPTDEEINQSMTNICRCGTYSKIRSAIKKVALDRGET